MQNILIVMQKYSYCEAKIFLLGCKNILIVMQNILIVMQKYSYFYDAMLLSLLKSKQIVNNIKIIIKNMFIIYL